ncbi:cyclic nucleotide-binding domain-containing protein [Methyloraptor flagellatus]|uniref:Cyclic nucleotide-binding domain-containing protein n=1 Tax=Methyloraptor flagellatus TaxID=3162530 RepID=A0AAU7X6D2_9HYPH
MRKVLYILSRLTDTDVEWLAAVGQRRQVSAGTVLIEEGAESTALIFVLDGEVSVSTAAVGHVTQLGVGEILGEISFVDKSPTSATVTATVTSQILAVDRALMMARLAEDPGFAARFYQAVAMFLAVRLRATTRRLGGAAPEPYDDLNLEMLDTVHVAGAHFDRLIKRLLGV